MGITANPHCIITVVQWVLLQIWKQALRSSATSSQVAHLRDSFPVFVTYYHKHSGLKQHKFITSQLWRLVSKWVGRAVFLLGAVREKPFLAFPVSIGHILWFMPQNITLISASIFTSTSSLPAFLLFSYKEPCDDIGPQGNLPSKILNHICKEPFCHLRWHIRRFQGLGWKYL